MSYIDRKLGVTSKTAASAQKPKSHRQSDPLARMLAAAEHAEGRHAAAGQPGQRLVSMSREEFVKKFS